jgi:putative drug exporter of the RND superfamily
MCVRSFMMPSVAALIGRWFWWPTRVRTRPASQMLRPYGPRSAVRAYMLPKEAESADSANTDRFPASAPHY